MPRRLPRTITVLLAALTLLALPAAASASRHQAQIIEDDPQLVDHTAATLAQFRELGATTVRVFLHWQAVAPDPLSNKKPAGFDGANLADYSPNGWGLYDDIIRDATSGGMTVDLLVSGGPPRWAQGSGIPPQGRRDVNFAWKPDAAEYGKFVHAAGVRYSGTYTPPGASSPLPRVHFWTIWNEPNFGQDLGPQAIDGSRVSVGPVMYRSLVDAAWPALRQTGHGADTILIGGLAAQGRSGPVNAKHPQGLPGDYAQTKPLQFIRTLYCLSPNDKPLRGRPAGQAGCPPNAAGTRAFRAKNPGLFAATGFADHPYSGGRSPVDAHGLDKNFAIFPQIGSLERTLDGVQRVYGSRKHFPIYSDEYGYITRPPQTAPYVSPAKAAVYLNWSEYLSWRNPRIASYAQYLLNDPTPTPSLPAGFASGLRNSKGVPKAIYYAYRLPIYLPKTTVSSGRNIEVWGNARPAHLMQHDSGQPQTVQIQFQRSGNGDYTTLRTVPLTGPDGYFDVRTTFSGSGKVRLAYSYPPTDPMLPLGVPGTTVYSRTVALRVR